MNNKPICGRLRDNNIMPREFESCIFEFKVNERKKEMVIGCFRRGKIVKVNLNYDGNYDFVCDTDAVIRWCYIDLN